MTSKRPALLGSSPSTVLRALAAMAVCGVQAPLALARRSPILLQVSAIVADWDRAIAGRISLPPCHPAAPHTAPSPARNVQYCHDSESLVTTRLALQHYLGLSAAEASVNCCALLLRILLLCLNAAVPDSP